MSAISPDRKSIAVLLPAWKPDRRLLDLIESLHTFGFTSIVVIDDGSGDAYAATFAAAAALGSDVLHHKRNLGKGRALKTGFDYLLPSASLLSGVITADADGQHRPSDIARVADAFQARPMRPVFGVRTFSSSVPYRSRLGNALTRIIFRILTGVFVSDTQTGLRVFPASMLPELLSIEGDRYEYEMNVLMHICRKYEPPVEIPVNTLYIDANRSSHFHPVRDSMRIYFVIARFCMSSLAAAALDFFLFAITFVLTHSLAWSIILGRLSSLLNFVMNRSFVFRNRSSLAAILSRYYSLTVAIALTSYAALRFLTAAAHWNVFVAKLCVDAPLSLASFYMQRLFIFRQRNAS